jgi:hypothetical protein
MAKRNKYGKTKNTIQDRQFWLAMRSDSQFRAIKTKDENEKRTEKKTKMLNNNGHGVYAWTHPNLYPADNG